MPTDPRLATMALGTGDQLAPIRQDLADLRRRIEVLERAPTVQAGSGAPTQSVRDGTLYVDATGLKLYVRVGGAWKSTTLT